MSQTSHQQTPVGASSGSVVIVVVGQSHIHDGPSCTPGESLDFHMACEYCGRGWIYEAPRELVPATLTCTGCRQLLPVVWEYER